MQEELSIIEKYLKEKEERRKEFWRELADIMEEAFTCKSLQPAS